MDAKTKARRMLKLARAAYAKAEFTNDQAAMDEIEETKINPLRRLLRKMELTELLGEAERLNALSGIIENSLLELQGRIDRFFLDDFIEEAEDLDLISKKSEDDRESRKETASIPPASGTPLIRAVTRTPVGTRHILVTMTDLDALMRVANSEVGHFGRYGEAQLRGGLAAVVDTVFNRVAHDKYPDTIQDVIDQPAQFSAINRLGSWTGLPQAPDSIARIITDHVRARADGRESEIQGATNFLNPYISSQSAMKRWGQHVKNNPVAIYGSDQNKDVHYHGFAPGATRPGPYIIAFEGNETLFDGSGHVLSDTSPGTNILSSHVDIRRRIVEICRAEHEYFNHGQAREADDPQYLRVGDYWKTVGSPNNGRTINYAGKRPAWSAAFISFVLQEAGAGDRFPYAAGHCIYFQYFVDRTGPLLYEAVLVTDFVPQPGDILHHGRDTAEHYDFTAARGHFGDDGWYPSHSDIVVSVDLQAKQVKTIGGNVSDSVNEKTYIVDDNGFLKDREKDGQTYPWIGMLRLT